MAVYLHHFASYFSEEWLPEKLVLMLMSSEGRESALEVCFQAMRKEDEEAFKAWAEGLEEGGGGSVTSEGEKGGGGEDPPAWRKAVLGLFEEAGVTSGEGEDKPPAPRAGSSLRGSASGASSGGTAAVGGASHGGAAPGGGKGKGLLTTGLPRWPRVDPGHDFQSFFMDEDYVEFLQSRAVRMLGWLGVLKPEVVERAREEEWRLFAAEIEGEMA